MIRRSSVTKILPIVAGAAVLSCAKTKISSTTPGTIAPVQFHRVLAVVPLSDLRARERIEAEFGRAYAGPHQDVFVSSSTVFDDVPAVTIDRMASVFRSHRIDAVLLLLPMNDGVFEGRRRGPEELARVAGLPPLEVMLVNVLTDPAAAFTWLMAVPQRAPCRECERAPRLPVAPRRTGDPWIRFSAMLRDAETGRVVWSAAVRTTSGSGGGRLLSVAPKTVGQLSEDGIIP
jgi:hypothetical protein